jgi:hypothetical protein
MRCRQSRVLRLLPEEISASRRLFAGLRDRDLANTTVLAFMDLNEPIANEERQVPRQRRSLEALEAREARRRNGSGLDQRRQQGELRPPNARPSHSLLEGAGQVSAAAARGGAHALPGGEEVDLFRFHFTCIYTIVLDVKGERAILDEVVAKGSLRNGE